jgi:hypothetical protein
MPRAPFALILKISDTYLPFVYLLINGMSTMSTDWKDSVQAEGWEQQVAGVLSDQVHRRCGWDPRP